jgi:hypothetical protein
MADGRGGGSNERQAGWYSSRGAIWGDRPGRWVASVSVLTILLCAFLGTGVSKAIEVGEPAGITRPRPGPGQALPQTPSSAMTYHGGAVQVLPKVYLDFWGWSGDPQGAEPYVEGFLGGIGGTSWNATVTQYCQEVSIGSTGCSPTGQPVGNPTGMLVGVWADPSTVPSSPSETQVAEEAASAAAHFGITKATPNVQIVVATPTGHSTPGFGSSFCAYHSTVGTSAGTISFTNLPYMPDAGGSCGENAVNSGSAGILDGYGIVEGHELAETETDPQPQSGWNEGSGSTEIGDLCAWKGLTDISTSRGTFAVQPLWSNESLSCVASHTFTSAPTVTAGSPTNVEPTWAVINGTVNPNGPDTHYYVQYGETTAYGSSTPELDAGFGTTPRAVSATVTGLQPVTAYHYRVVAASWAGTSYGADQVLTTPTTLTSSTAFYSPQTGGPQAYFVRKSDNRIHETGWTASSGWTETGALSTEVAAGTSVSAFYSPQTGGPQAYFVRKSDNVIHETGWTGSSGWTETGGLSAEVR